MEDKDLPSLYQNADKCAVHAQQCHLLLKKLHFGCLVVCSGIPASSLYFDSYNMKYIYGALTVFLVMGIIFSFLSRLNKYDVVWFESRVIAESVKTAAWRYMMGIQPFQNDQTARKEFIAEIKRIRSMRCGIQGNLARYSGNDSNAISNFMDDMRQKPLEDKKRTYISSRLREQKDWYSQKATSNSKDGDCYFWIAIVLQIAAVIFSILKIVQPSLPLNLVPLLMTIASISIAWSHMRRHGELANEYYTMSQNLKELEEASLRYNEEAIFLKQVDEAEIIMSREHEIWAVRRNVAWKSRS